MIYFVVGSIGRSLQTYPSVYLSPDGGVTWREVGINFTASIMDFIDKALAPVGHGVLTPSPHGKGFILKTRGFDICDVFYRHRTISLSASSWRPISVCFTNCYYLNMKESLSL